MKSVLERMAEEHSAEKMAIERIQAVAVSVGG